MTDREKMGFAGAVWDAFIAKTRGPDRLCSPLEWSLMKKWLDSDAPLRIVLRGIKDCPKAGSTLTYYEKPVEAEYRRWASGL